jgi:multiple sugar transport system permease protein
MKFIIFLILILGVIGNLQHFDIIWVMTQGGPAQATTTLAVEVYRRAFQNWELGVAAAIGVLWVLLISIFAFFYIRNLERDS